MRRLLTVWLVGVLAATILGACGGGDDEGADGLPAAVATDDEGDEGDGGTDGDDSSTTDDGDGDDGDDAGSAAGVFSATNCAEAIQAYSAGATSAAQAMSGDTKAMKASIEQMEEFADDAPGEIRDELRTMSKAWSGYVTAIAEAGWDPRAGKPPSDEQAKLLEEAGNLFEEADYKEAQAKIDDWFASDCGGR